MIIEIKDLPSDRKVKHITFDITFEEDGTPIVKQSPAQQIIQHVHAAPVPVTAPIEMPMVTPREHKDIPPEMTNMEF